MWRHFPILMAFVPNHLPSCLPRLGADGTEKKRIPLLISRDTEEFVVNIVSESFAERMVMCSTDFDSDVDEFDVAGLTPVASQKVSPPRVGESKLVLNAN